MPKGLNNHAEIEIQRDFNSHRGCACELADLFFFKEMIMELTAMDVAIIQREGTNALEILLQGDKAALNGHFEFAKAANGNAEKLADTLKCHYEELLTNKFEDGDFANGGWLHDVVHSLVFDGLALVDWLTFAKRIIFLMENRIHAISSDS